MFVQVLLVLDMGVWQATVTTWRNFRLVDIDVNLGMPSRAAASVALNYPLFTPSHRLLMNELNGSPRCRLHREVGLLEPGTGHAECSWALGFRPGGGAVGRLHQSCLLGGFNRLSDVLGGGDGRFIGDIRGIGLRDGLDPTRAGEAPGELPDAAAEEVEEEEEEEDVISSRRTRDTSHLLRDGCCPTTPRQSPCCPYLLHWCNGIKKTVSA